MKVELPELTNKQIDLLDMLPLRIVIFLLRKDRIGGFESYIQRTEHGREVLYIAYRDERRMLRIDYWTRTPSTKRRAFWRYGGWRNTLRDVNQFRAMYMR